MRLKRSRLLKTPLLTGLLLSIVAALLIWTAPWAPLVQLRERTFDALTQFKPPVRAPEIIVVDIDQASDSAATPWSRSRTAELLSKLGQAGAAVVAFDLVFSANCDAAAPENLALVAAMQQVPVVLGFLLSDLQQGEPAPRPPLAVRNPVDAPGVWFAEGAERSCPFFEAAAVSAAASSLAGDIDARIRLAPAVVSVAEAPYPGLGLEAVRIGKGWQIPIFGGVPPWLRLGSTTIPLDSGADLRFRASGPDIWALRTVSAAAVLSGAVSPDRLTDAIVFVGSSQPRFGGLRPTAANPLEPSVQIHADVANEVLGGLVPYRDARMPMLEALFTLLAGGLVTFAAVSFRPANALVMTAVVAIAWSVASAGLYWVTAQLLDPLYPALGVLGAYAVTSILQYAATRRAEETLRRRFGQHLPPSIVTRFIENPSLLKLEGEERVITTVFTDIESFTAITQLAGPRELITMLDGYFDGVVKIVTAHGGTVDKFVGDAVHAFFNAPLDLEGHTDKAIASALEIHSFTEAFRHRPENARYNFGRTRIGIETGVTVVGDVGAGGKIDYTAHGNAVNLAARLEAANKELGTAICIGPGARKNTTVDLTSLGEIDVRGFGVLEVFTPTELASAQRAPVPTSNATKNQRPTLA